MKRRSVARWNLKISGPLSVKVVKPHLFPTMGNGPNPILFIPPNGMGRLGRVWRQQSNVLINISLRYYVTLSFEHFVMVRAAAFLPYERLLPFVRIASGHL